MKTFPTILGSMVLCAWSSLVGWAAPPYVNYQGQLNDAGGQPLPTGNYTMEFNIYGQAQLGAKVWGPFLFDGGVGAGHGPQVPVANGRFNVIIGPQDTNGVAITAIFGDTNRYMEISVAGGPPILPRQQFLSTAYAFQAINAQKASSLIQELADALCPPGSILAFGGPTNNMPSGWLLCDGRAVSTNTYARLYGAISNAWGASGTDFNLPDLRGMFLRGVSHGRTDDYQDWDAETRALSQPGGNSGNNVGSVQTNRLSDHRHLWGTTDPAGDFFRSLWSWDIDNRGQKVVEPRVAGGGGSSGDDDWMWVPNQNMELYTAWNSTIHPLGETRPKNAYVNYIIKY